MNEKHTVLESKSAVEEVSEIEEEEEIKIKKSSLFERWSDKFREFLDNAE